MRSIASDGNFVEQSEFGVSGLELICCTSFLLGVSGDLLPGTIRRLMLVTRSRNDNAGLGGATGRCGNVWKHEEYKFLI